MVSVKKKTFLTEKQTGKVDKLKKEKYPPGHSQHAKTITPNKIQRIRKLPNILRLSVSAEAML